MFGRRGEPIDETVPDDEVLLDDEVEAADPAVTPVKADGVPEAEDPEAGETSDVEESPDDPAQRLAEELELVSDRHLRLAAEFENFRKRTRREQAELSVVAQADLSRRLLPTLDDLARVSSTPPETTTVEALDAGLDLILRNLRKELEEAGLTRIEAMGERFNPELHQALMTVDTPDRDLDDTVSRVFVDGYVFRDRLVRPAQVEVLTYSPEGGEDQ
ncbi:MAG: nucleotide exchange factor GrpE [Gemmatimonadetes bacterium]|nr:nucleotide exchange factor GrpE [Gemmatimonadota bacterium]MCK5489272.1 nucleotide exchange factor GrpE [Gemmatimonadota bacterium]